MKTKNQIIEKYRELCLLLDEAVDDMSPEVWKRRKDLYDAIAELKAEMDEQPDLKGAEEIFNMMFEGLNGEKGCYHFPDLKKWVLFCMEEYAALVERESCKKCAMAWTKDV